LIKARPSGAPFFLPPPTLFNLAIVVTLLSQTAGTEGPKTSVVCLIIADLRHKRPKNAPGLSKKCRPAALKGRKRARSVKKSQTGSTFAHKTLAACSKTADLQHRSRIIRPPAATDRALRGALALKALLAPDCCSVGSGKKRAYSGSLVYEMAGENRFDRLYGHSYSETAKFPDQV